MLPVPQTDVREFVDEPIVATTPLLTVRYLALRTPGGRRVTVACPVQKRRPCQPTLCSST
jgi:hypothetical protein